MWTSAYLNSLIGVRNNSKARLTSVRYSAISSQSSGIILPLDVEDTVTCFCRLFKN